MRVVVVLGLLAVSSMAAAFTFDAEVPAAVQQQMTQDLQFVGSIQGSNASQFHQQIFGRVDGASYKQFFESRVNAIGMNPCGSDGRAVACVIPMLDHTKMWLTPNFVKFQHPQIARMMVVFHEARHTELAKGFWGHAKCPTPFVDASGNEIRSIWTQMALAGQAACDKTPLGSYGSSTIMLKNISKFCTNCNGKVKMDAGLYADDQIKRITNPAAKDAMVSDLRQALGLMRLSRRL